MRQDYLFTKQDLRRLLDHFQNQIKDTVQGYTRDYLLNVSESDLADHLLSEFILEAPMLKQDALYIKGHSETDIDVSQDPTRAIFDRGQPAYIKGVSLTIAIPFDGEARLFEYVPSTFTTIQPRGRIGDQELILTYDTTEHDPQALKRRYEADLNLIESHLGWVRGQVNEYNKALPEFVKSVISARKQRLLADEGLVAALGIPIKRREEDRGTYAPQKSKENRRSHDRSRPHAALPQNPPSPVRTTNTF